MSVYRHYSELSHGKVGSSKVVIDAAVTNPTKASSPSFDVMRWARTGDIVTCSMQYVQPNNTGAAAGSGTYYFRLPIPAIPGQTIIGNCYILSGAEEFHGSVYLQGTNHCTLKVQNETAATAVVSSGDYDLATVGDTEYSIHVTYVV